MTDRGDPPDEPTDDETEKTAHADEVDADSTPERDGESHLDDVQDGAGCTEIWEHLSENRDD